MAARNTLRPRFVLLLLVPLFLAGAVCLATRRPARSVQLVPPAASPRLEGRLESGPWNLERGEAPRAMPAREERASADRAPEAPALDAAQGEPEPRITGWVRDGAGRPLALARVELYEDRESAYSDWGPAMFAAARGPVLAAAEVNEHAEFSLATSGAELALVRAVAPGYVAAEVGGLFPGPPIELILAQAATLAGKLTRASDATAVGAARVRVFHGQSGELVAETKSASDGEYRLDGLSAGTVELQVVPVGLAAPRIIEIELAAGVAVRRDVALEDGWTLVGMVRDARTNAPIAAAEVSAWEFLGTSAHTDARGFFRLEGVRARPGTLVARASGYGRSERDYAAPGEDLDLELERGRRLVGRVVDDARAPLAGARIVALGMAGDVRLRRDVVATYTVADGAFELDDVRADLELVLGVNARARAAMTFVVPSGEPGSTTDLGELVAERGATLRARVLTPDGRGCGGVDVFLEGPAGAPEVARVGFLLGRAATTDATGACRFAELAAGTWSVRIVAPNASPVTELVELAAGEVRSGVEWHLAFSGVLEGTLHDAAGSPVAGAHVLLRAASGPLGGVLQCTSAGDGAFAFTGVASGTYTLLVHPAPEPQPRIPLAPLALSGIEPDGRFLALRLERASASVAGRVVARAGGPVAAALVSVDRGDVGLYDGVLCDAAGAFRIAVPPGAPVRLRAWRTAELDASSSLALEFELGRRIVARDENPATAVVEPGAVDVLLEVE